MEEQLIIANPLNGLVAREIRPKWMCKHPRAELLDRKRMVFLCDVCNPNKGAIRVIPYTKPGKTSPSKVTIASSPKKDDEKEPQSPGFK